MLYGVLLRGALVSIVEKQNKLFEYFILIFKNGFYTTVWIETSAGAFLQLVREVFKKNSMAYDSYG